MFCKVLKTNKFKYSISNILYLEVGLLFLLKKPPFTTSHEQASLRGLPLLDALIHAETFFTNYQTFTKDLPNFYEGFTRLLRGIFYQAKF